MSTPIKAISFGVTPPKNSDKLLEAMLKPLRLIEQRQRTDTFDKAIDSLANGKQEEMLKLAEQHGLNIPKNKQILDFCGQIGEKMGIDGKYVEALVKNLKELEQNMKELATKHEAEIAKINQNLPNK